MSGREEIEKWKLWMQMHQQQWRKCVRSQNTTTSQQHRKWRSRQNTSSGPWISTGMGGSIWRSSCHSWDKKDTSRCAAIHSSICSTPPAAAHWPSWTSSRFITSSKAAALSATPAIASFTERSSPASSVSTNSEIPSVCAPLVISLRAMTTTTTHYSWTILPFCRPPNLIYQILLLVLLLIRCFIYFWMQISRIRYF